MRELAKFMLYLFLKYVGYYLYLTIQKGLTWDFSNLRDTDDIMYTFWMLGLLPMLDFVVLSIPFCLFALRDGFVAIGCFVLIFVLDFLLTFHFLGDTREAFWKMAIGIVLFALFFGRRISAVMKCKALQSV
jgi:hypothetical protein